MPLTLPDVQRAQLPEPGRMGVHPFYIREMLFRPFLAVDLPMVRKIAEQAFTKQILPGVLATLDLHARCSAHSINDGRAYFLLLRDDKLAGFCGLHKYAWDVSDNVWASWFFTSPEVGRERRILAALGLGLLGVAKALGHNRLYVETYSDSPLYSPVSRLLSLAGFQLEATLPTYFTPTVDLLIYLLDLETWTLPRTSPIDGRPHGVSAR